MKTKVFLIGLISLFSFQLNAQSVFDKLSTEKDVTTIRITKSILEIMPEFAAGAKFNGIEIGALSKKLDLLEVFTTEKPELVRLMRDGMNEYKKKPAIFEEIMYFKDEDSEILFMVERENKNNETLKSLFMFIDSGDKGVIMRLLGSFTMNDVKDIVGEAELF